MQLHVSKNQLGANMGRFWLNSKLAKIIENIDSIGNGCKVSMNRRRISWLRLCLPRVRLMRPD